MLQLEPEGLVVGDLRAEDVAGAGAPLAVGLRGLPGALLVHGHLALELHVVEHDHLLPADDGHLPHLVGVEPRQVHVRDLAGREAEEAEDDVLDAGLHEVLPVRDDLRRLLAEQPEDDREVVDAERPERVLVRADHAEVLAVAVDAGHVAELTRVDELLHLAQAGVVEQQMPGHEHAVVGARERDELLHLLAAHRRRLLDEDVLARLERLLRERVVGRHGRRDRDGLDRVVGERLGERARDAGLRVARRVVGLSRRRRCRRPRPARSAPPRRGRRSCPSRRRRRGRRGSQLPDLLVDDAAPAHGVPQIDDEVGVRDEPGVVDAPSGRSRSRRRRTRRARAAARRARCRAR